MEVFAIDWQASRLLDPTPSKSDLTFHYDRDNLAGSHVNRKDLHWIKRTFSPVLSCFARVRLSIFLLSVVIMV